MHVFNILTLFPEFFQGPLKVSILKRALERKIIRVNVLNLRDFSRDKHRKCDDYPYGGGAGMVMSVQPIHDAIGRLKKKYRTAKVIVFSAKGKPMDQALIREMKRHRRFILIAGHYEGIDERVMDHYADHELSMGDYVLTGGEYACLVFMDAVARLLRGVIQNRESSLYESFEDGRLEYDQYTRPEMFRGKGVPGVLLSGDHEKVRRWRQESSLRNTRENRPDLLRKGERDEYTGH